MFNQFRTPGFEDKSQALIKNGLSGAIAVLPLLNNKPGSESEYFGFAIADQIIGELNYLKNINVRSSSSVRQYANMIVDQKKIKEELNVDYILVGNYLKEANRIRLNVELIELETNQMIWRSDKIEVDYINTFELQDIVAKKVVNGLNIKFSPNEFNRMNKDIPNDPLAYEYYLRSISYPLTSIGDELAIEMINKSISLDSLYAPAFSELGFRTQRLAHFEMKSKESFSEAEKYYLKALRINPDLLSALGYLADFIQNLQKQRKRFELLKR